eukprot:scaffold10721_cov164-Amphora_coffeaeformis.AAC.2
MANGHAENSLSKGCEDVARCTLHVARCTLHVARCTLHVARCTLHVARCTLHVARCTLHVALGSAEWVPVLADYDSLPVSFGLPYFSFTQ